MLKIILLCTVFGATPNITNYPPIRSVTNFDSVINDIESHLPANHPYWDRDPITFTHEGTHGINSQLRNLFGKPGFYLLDNRAVVLNREPLTTLTLVSRLVPVSLRGDVYNLYLIQSRRWWENQPSYLFDEWTAYTNGAEARRQLAIHERAETVRYMLEFCVYSTCVPWAAKSDDPQVRSFLMWQIERSLRISKASGISSRYLILLRVSTDATELRLYMRDYFGFHWTKEVLGF